jgi:hypothetical protein
MRMSRKMKMNDRIKMSKIKSKRNKPQILLQKKCAVKHYLLYCALPIIEKYFTLNLLRNNIHLDSQGIHQLAENYL